MDTEYSRCQNNTFKGTEREQLSQPLLVIKASLTVSQVPGIVLRTSVHSLICTLWVYAVICPILQMTK